MSPNTLERNFSAENVNERFVSDITYIQLATGFCYLAVIIDLFSRAVVGHKIANTLDTDELVKGAFLKCVELRGVIRGALFHSDRGCQYTSQVFRELLTTYGVEQSMSRKGNCWDNAACESFFASLKWELMDNSTRVFSSIEEATKEIEGYVRFYNFDRPHSFLGGKTPHAFELQQLSNRLSTGFESPPPDPLLLSCSQSLAMDKDGESELGSPTTTSLLR
jgi:transposase InsO family protein